MKPLTSSQQNHNHNHNQMESALQEDELELSAVAELEALSTNNLLNYIIHDTQFYPSLSSQLTTLPLHNNINNSISSSSNNNNGNKNNLTMEKKRGVGAGAGAKRKRKRRVKVCKNKEEAETQRMTHITVERNRRKLMNEHLAMLRTLMPEHYVQRGDQASIVGGAIEYVKELEHLLQTLEAQKLLIHTATASSSSPGDLPPPPQPFSQFFSYPQYTWTTQNNMSNIITSDKNIMLTDNTYKCMAMSSLSNDVADIEVSMIETHASVRILSRRSFSQLSKMVSAFYSVSLSILHLNVTTLNPLVLYSISAKVEEGCLLTSADDIAGAVHHMLRIIQEEATLC